MKKYIGIICLDLKYMGCVGFERTKVFEAEDDDAAYDKLHEIIDRNKSNEEQHSILNDWVIQIDDDSQARLV